MNQDLYGMEMSCFDESDWNALARNDEMLEAEELHQAYKQIYLAVDELEAIYRCGLPDLRAEIRFTEIVAHRKVKYERE